MKKYTGLTFCILSFCLTNARAEGVDLDWLAGAWCRSTLGVSGEEHWMRNQGGIMLGMSRTITKRGMEYEFVRIEVSPKSARYVAMPSGQSETAFELTEIGAASVTFSNPTHDFPKRVRYWREHDRLFARIDGGAQSSEFRNFEWVRCERP